MHDFLLSLIFGEPSEQVIDESSSDRRRRCHCWGNILPRTRITRLPSIPRHQFSSFGLDGGRILVHRRQDASISVRIQDLRMDFDLGVEVLYHFGNS